MSTSYLQTHRNFKPHDISRHIIQRAKQHNRQNDLNGDRAGIHQHDRPHIREMETRIMYQQKGFDLGRSVPQRTRQLVQDMYRRSPELSPRTPSNFIHHASTAVYMPISYQSPPACVQGMSGRS
jgi:hypothetical protein